MITDEYGKKEIQTNLLQFVKWFDSFCKENDIQYTLHGGTLLGAIREKGFIPWDDDVDIGMFREQYKKLVKLISKDKSSNVYLDSDSDKIKKIWLNQDGCEKVWIDIFIYDYISERSTIQKLKIIGLKLLTAFSKSKETIKIFRANNKAKGISKIMYEIIYLIGRPFPLKSRTKVYDKFSESSFVGKKQFVHRANDQLWAMPMIVPLEYVKTFKYVQFEDTKLMASANYDAILTQLYGVDYMTPKKVTEKSHDIVRKNA